MRVRVPPPALKTKGFSCARLARNRGSPPPLAMKASATLRYSSPLIDGSSRGYCKLNERNR